jgi:hypothetical protein
MPASPGALMSRFEFPLPARICPIAEVQTAAALSQRTGRRCSYDDGAATARQPENSRDIVLRSHMLAGSPT